MKIHLFRCFHPFFLSQFCWKRPCNAGYVWIPCFPLHLLPLGEHDLGRGAGWTEALRALALRPDLGIPAAASFACWTADLGIHLASTLDGKHGFSIVFLQGSANASRKCFIGHIKPRQGSLPKTQRQTRKWRGWAAPRHKTLIPMLTGLVAWPLRICTW